MGPEHIKFQLNIDVIDCQSILVEELLPTYNDISMNIFGQRIPAKILSNYIKELVNWSVTEFFYGKGLRAYNVGDKRTKKVFYFNYGVKSKRHPKSRPMNLAGKYQTIRKWHYGLSAYYVDFPISGIMMNAHIVFTDSSGTLLKESSQIAARRKKGRLFYNKQWRDLLLTAMYYLADGKDSLILAPYCCNNSFKIDRDSIGFISPVGYEEPFLKEDVNEYND